MGPFPQILFVHTHSRRRGTSLGEAPTLGSLILTAAEAEAAGVPAPLQGSSLGVPQVLTGAAGPADCLPLTCP